MVFEFNFARVDSNDLAELANLLGKLEFEFCDRPALETFFQELRDIMQSEFHLRQIGQGNKGIGRFEVLDKSVLYLAELLALARIAVREEKSENAGRRTFGTCLLTCLVLN